MAIGARTPPAEAIMGDFYPRCFFANLLRFMKIKVAETSIRHQPPLPQLTNSALKYTNGICRDTTTKLEIEIYFCLELSISSYLTTRPQECDHITSSFPKRISNIIRTFMMEHYTLSLMSFRTFSEGTVLTSILSSPPTFVL